MKIKQVFGRRFAAALALGGAMFAASSAQAALIAFEDFESYTAGSSLSGSNGGFGWTSSWTGAAQATVQAKTLVDPNAIVTGGTNALQLKLTADNAAFTDITNAFSRSFAPTSDTFYVSYMIRVESFEDNDFVAVINSNGATGNALESLSTGVRNNPGNPVFSRVGTSNDDTDNVTSGAGSTVADNTDFVIVAKYSKVSGSLDYNQTEVFVNPLNTTEPGVASALSNDADPTLTQMSLLTGRYRSNEISDTVYLDSFRVATTFEEALTGQAPFVPVPPSQSITTADGNGADAHVRGDGSSANTESTNFNLTTLEIKNAQSDQSFHRKAYLRFDLSQYTLPTLDDAELSLTVESNLGVAQNKLYTFALYGLNDDFVPAGAELSEENWGETLITGLNAPGNVVANGVDVDLNDMFGGAELLTFEILGGGNAGDVLTLSSDALTEFLKSNLGTDGNATFILVRLTQETNTSTDTVVHRFRSGEFTGGGAPTLTLYSSIIPEPSVAILGMLSLAGLGLRRRRLA